jgi:hypothetical protein
VQAMSGPAARFRLTAVMSKRIRKITGAKRPGFCGRVASRETTDVTRRRPIDMGTHREARVS